MTSDSACVHDLSGSSTLIFRIQEGAQRSVPALVYCSVCYLCARAPAVPESGLHLSWSLAIGKSASSLFAGEAQSNSLPMASSSSPPERTLPVVDIFGKEGYQTNSQTSAPSDSSQPGPSSSESLAYRALLRAEHLRMNPHDEEWFDRLWPLPTDTIGGQTSIPADHSAGFAPASIPVPIQSEYGSSAGGGSSKAAETSDGSSLPVPGKTPTP